MCATLRQLASQREGPRSEGDQWLDLLIFHLRREGLNDGRVQVGGGLYEMGEGEADVGRAQTNHLPPQPYTKPNSLKALGSDQPNCRTVGGEGQVQGFTPLAPGAPEYSHSLTHSGTG